MELRETSTNLVETIAHYQIYESARDKGTYQAFFIIDTFNESNHVSPQWTLEDAKYTVERKVEAEAEAAENLRANRKYMEVKPHVSNEYEVGALLKFSWGYDQTNIDYFVIVAVSKSGNYVTLLPVGSISADTGWLRGDCVPSNTISFHAKAFRRKLAKDKDGKPFGVAIRSYGWCSLYSGGVDHWTAYH